MSGAEREQRAIYRKNLSFFIGFFICSILSCLAGGEFVSAKTLDVQRVGTRGSIGAPQGMAYDRDKKCLVITASELARCGGGDGKCNDGFYKVQVNGSSVGSITTIGGKGIINHGNGLTYNTKIKRVIAAYDRRYYTLRWNGDNLEVEKKEKGSRSSGAIGYSIPNDKYYASGGNNGKILKLNWQVENNGTFDINGGEKGKQDGDAYGDYYYIVYASSQGGHDDHVGVYNMKTKKHVKTYEVPGVDGEAESIAFTENSAFIVSNACGSGMCLYKVTDSAFQDLIQGAGSNGPGASNQDSVAAPVVSGSVDPEKFEDKYKKVKTVKVKKYKAPKVKAKKANQEENCSAILPDAWCNGGKDSVMNVLNLALTVITAGVGVVGLLGIVLAGLQYAAAGGSEEMVAKSKRRIAAIVVGIALWVFLYILMRTFLLGEI